MAIAPKISIVIPAYNGWDLLHQLLWDIHENCKGVYEVLVSDNDSDDEGFIKGLRFWKKSGINIPLRVIHNEENVGFLKNSNIALREAKGDLLCLVSTDVRILSRNFLATLTGSWHVNQRQIVAGMVYSNPTGWNTFGDVTVPYAEGWLLALPKWGWEELGYFDERYAPCVFEDVDLSMKAVSTGYGLYQLPHGVVRHVGGATIKYTEERHALTRLNRSKFEEKWKDFLYAN